LVAHSRIFSLDLLAHFLRINAVSRGRWHDTREELFFLSPVIIFLPGRLAAIDFSHNFVRALLGSNPNRTASRVFFGPSTSLPPAILAPNSTLGFFFNRWPSPSAGSGAVAITCGTASCDTIF